MATVSDPLARLRGWVGVRLDRGLDREIVEGVLASGYRMVAPRRAIAKLDGGKARGRGAGASPPWPRLTVNPVAGSSHRLTRRIVSLT